LVPAYIPSNLVNIADFCFTNDLYCLQYRKDC
jgi:hypothetical protein